MKKHKFLKVLLFLVLLVIAGCFVTFGKNKFESKPKIAELTSEPSIIIQEKETLVLGQIKKMKTTCYTLVEFASKGITANGYRIQSEDGWFKKAGKQFIANNSLPFGTRVKIEGFGDTIFEVIDRIGWGTELDIYWGDNINAYQDCVENFGAKNLEILILYDKPSTFVK